ncbi:DUF411 domain-containing protein [Sinorhizobium sp. 7-81]|uniref:DUF411 domain-containing protein n=1 Tax=Sinorhizobium sp. 8-89 TaxID=3049089 RepID=UPI0024C3B209|nr:DUF411 domain-containing protein [Sinorhizobium sp. 8-89]MDK1489832.1 DUF411 domain-containing protein [Sinorhizobium sp. 8-89]
MSRILKAVVLASLLFGATSALAGEKDVTLYKTPECGCCEGYADYLRENGFDVTVKPTHDLAAMSREAGIPDEFHGCHLSMIDGYAVSGHVPIGTVNKLLTERPDIRGVTLPGMPMGSPGMSGTKEAPFKMLEIKKSGGIGGVYASE